MTLNFSKMSKKREAMKLKYNSYDLKKKQIHNNKNLLNTAPYY